MKRIYIIGLLLSFALIQGCMDDKGSYDYREVNKMTIESLQDVNGNKASDTITIISMEYLKLSPVLSHSMGEADSELSFRWYIYETTGGSEETISTERELDWLANVIPSRYNARLEVTDDKTGVLARYKFYIFVVKENTGNLMLFSNVDGEASLSVMKPDGSWIEDAFAQSNGYSAGRNAVWGANARIAQSITGEQSVILCDDGDGGAFFSNNNYQKVTSFRDAFYFVPEVIRPEAYLLGYQFYNQENDIDFIINNKKLHYRYADMIDQGAKFGPALPGDYELYPGGILAYGTCLFYDQKNRRFVQVTSDLWGDELTVKMESAFLYRYSYNPALVQAWHPDDVGLDMIYFDRLLDDNAYAVMSDPGNPGKLYRLKFFAGGLPWVSWHDGGYQNYWYSFWKQPVDAANRLSEAQSFTMNRVYGFIYYAVDSKIYRYDIENDSNKEILDVSTLLSGNQVDCLYIQNAESYSNEYNLRLFAAISETGGSGLCGSLLDIRMKVNGEYDSHTLYKNKTGRVVSMSHQL